MIAKVHVGDCLEVLDQIDSESIDLVYVDPPFFTQATHRLQTRDGKKIFSFEDFWDSHETYANFLFQRLTKIHSKLKPSGSIFFHCDKSATHIIRMMLDRVFGSVNFQSEIIWHFRRWSNAKRGLLNSHQTIYFFSKGPNFKFNPSYQDYSPTTNIDQIMQKRIRDARDKSVYARRQDGEIITNGSKKGVPLADVWEIPFLNPKARERVGYPTQKPVLLLKKIIALVTDSGDTVLDPFCGSGTTLVAAQELERNAIGIDVSSEAMELTRERLKQPVVTESTLLAKGLTAYQTHDQEAAVHLAGIDYVPVHRNKGIDGVLKHEINGLPVFLRVQRHLETQDQAAAALLKASRNKGACLLVVVATEKDLMPRGENQKVKFVNSACMSLQELETETKKDVLMRPLVTEMG